MQTEHDGYTISTDKARLDVGAIHRYLSEESYWARARTRECIDKCIANSLCFGVYAPDGSLAGFARVVGDGCTFAWLCDVFILTPHRGRGLSKWLVKTVMEHPECAGTSRFMLGTRDAHELYRKYGGFVDLAYPDRWLERVRKPAHEQAALDALLAANAAAAEEEARKGKSD